MKGNDKKMIEILPPKIVCRFIFRCRLVFQKIVLAGVGDTKCVQLRNGQYLVKYNLKPNLLLYNAKVSD